MKKYTVKQVIGRIVLVAVVALVIGFNLGQDSVTDRIEWIEVVAQPGDDFWTVVANNQIDRDAMDLRILIKEAKKENDASYMIAGESYKIPVFPVIK